MPITLPTSKLAPTTREPRNLFIYGRPKVGKSTACAALPNSLHLDLQQGTLFVQTARVIIDTPEQLAEVIAALPDHWRKNPFRFLIVDVVDQIEDWADGIATANYKRLPTGKNFAGESVLELDHGAGYRWLRNAFKDTLNKLQANAMWSTVYVGHVRDKYADATSKVGTQVAEADVDLTGKIKSIMCQRVDAIGYMFRDALGKLKLSFETKDQINCGNRAAYLAGKTLSFSTPTKAEDWAQIYPDSWNKAVAPEQVAKVADDAQARAAFAAQPTAAKLAQLAAEAATKGQPAAAIVGGGKPVVMPAPVPVPTVAPTPAPASAAVKPAVVAPAPSKPTAPAPAAPSPISVKP